MAAPDRLTRVNELLKRELSRLISRASIAPSAAVLVSVTEVRSSVDLRNATVSVSVFGGKDGSAAEEVLNRLRGSRADFQKELGTVLGFKHTPVLEFRLDTRVAAGDHVLELIEELEKERPGQ